MLRPWPQAINLLMSGETEVTKYKDETRGKRYDLRIRLNPEERRDPDDLGRLYVRSRDGRLVELRNLVRVQEGGGPSVINREDRQRAVTLFASLEGVPLGAAMEGLNGIAAKILPPDYLPKYRGQADTMAESFGYLLFAIILGVAMAYMVLAAQFESFVHPFTVLLSMPLSFIGAFGALLLTGNTISIFSFIGLILLMGLVKKNAILLVDYTNVLRERGALPEGGDPRGRPGPAAADPDDDLRDGLRDDAGRLRHGRGGGNPRSHGDRGHRRPPYIALSDAGGRAGRLRSLRRLPGFLQETEEKG